MALIIGLTGQGMTIGVLSGSFNRAPNSVTTSHPAQDIKSADLPGRGNPFGDTTPIVVLGEDPVAAPMKAAVNDGFGLIDAFAAHEKLKWSAAPAK